MTWSSRRRGANIDEASVKAYLRERVAGYKIPGRVELAADLPREDSGKIFKRKPREPFWAGNFGDSAFNSGVARALPISQSELNALSQQLWICYSAASVRV